LGGNESIQIPLLDFGDGLCIILMAGAGAVRAKRAIRGVLVYYWIARAENRDEVIPIEVHS
jgi:hypothetical protein